MPQLDKLVIKERAQRLRAKGEERLVPLPQPAIGAHAARCWSRPCNSGRTEHFAPVKFAQSLTPGAIVTAQVTGARADHLEARLAA